MQIIPEMVKILLPAAEKLVQDIAEAQDQKIQFIVNLSMMEEIQMGKFSIIPDVVIEAGNPPVLNLSYLLFLQFLNESDDKLRKRLKNRIRQLISISVSKLPRMQRTLAIQPIAEIIAVKDGIKNMFKSNQKDKFIFKLPDSSIEFTTTITVVAREIHTNQTVTLTGTDESFLKQKARTQLTSLVEMNEILAVQLEKEAAPPLALPPSLTAIRLTEGQDPEIYTKFGD